MLKRRFIFVLRKGVGLQAGKECGFACFLLAVNTLQNDCSGVGAFEEEKEWFVEADVFFILGIYDFVFHGLFHALKNCFGRLLKAYFRTESYCGMLPDYSIRDYVGELHFRFRLKVFE